MTDNDSPTQLSRLPAPANRWAARLFWLALLWFGLNGPDWKSWLVGGPVVVAAAWISVKLLPAHSWQWSARGALGFAGFFLRESWRGGWDVAWRALSPRRPLAPALVRYPLRLPAGAARLFFASVIGLLPGTVVVAIAADHFWVHVLEESPRVEVELRNLESRVARLFGAPLAEGKETGL